MNIYVPGIGNPNARIMFIGEAPSYEEELQLKPLVGPAGREFNNLLRDSGINRDICWITNACKFMVPPNTKTRKIPFRVRAEQVGIDLDQQYSDLRNEIYSINPNIIVPLGETALNAVTGKNKISDWRGSIILGMGKKCVATYHPAHLLYQEGEIKGYWNRQVMIFDLRRALKQSSFPEVVLPSRNLHIIRDSAELHDFIYRYRTYSNPSIDIEAHPNGSGIPICIGVAFTPYEGIAVPLWNCDGISSISDSDMVSIWIMLADFLAEQEIVGQNFKYDQDKIRRLGFIIKRLFSDTMLKAFAINPELPKNLAFNTSIYTEEPFYKHEGMYEGSIKDLLIGCARDACVTKEVDLAMDADLDQLDMREYYENFILKLHDLYLDIESVGFAVDTEQRARLLQKYIEWDERLSYERFKLCGHEVNPGSPKQVSILLYEELKIPSRAGTGEEILTALLNQVKKQEHRDMIVNILDARRVRKTISTYLMAIPDYDGRMKTTYFPCLETGRTSTGQLEAPIRPTIHIKEDGKKKKKSIGMAFQTISKHGDIGQDVRSMFVPG